MPKREDKRKFRSQKRKKGRNLAGARKKARLFAEERSVSEPLGHSSATPPDPAAGPNENSQTLTKEEDHNVSLLKLMNSSFDSFIEGPVTRSKPVEKSARNGIPILRIKSKYDLILSLPPARAIAKVHCSFFRKPDVQQIASAGFERD